MSELRFGEPLSIVSFAKCSITVCVIDSILFLFSLPYPGGSFTLKFCVWKRIQYWSVAISSKMSFCRYQQLAFIANFSSCFPGLILLQHGWTWVLSCPVWNFTIKQRQVTTLLWLIAESTLIATIILEIWLVLAWTNFWDLFFDL